MREFIIDKTPLDTAIKSLQPFISKEDTRYYLCGIFFEWKNGDDKINMVATDGHKLCVLQVDMIPSADTEGDIAAIVPTSALKTILQILKAIGNDKMPVTLKFDDNNLKLWIETPNQKAELQLIDGNFLDYRRVVPTEKATFTIGLQKAQATEAMKAMRAHKGKEAMEWQMTDANRPLKLVGQDKLVIVMPTRSAFSEIDLGTAD